MFTYTDIPDPKNYLKCEDNIAIVSISSDVKKPIGGNKFFYIKKRCVA